MLIYWTNNKKKLNHSFLGEDSSSFINLYSTKSDSLPSDNFSCSFETNSDDTLQETFSFVKKVEEFEKDSLIHGLQFNLQDFISLEENVNLLYDFMQRDDKFQKDKNKILNIIISKIESFLQSYRGLEIIYKLLCISQLRDKKILVENMLNNIEYLVENSNKEIFSLIVQQIIKMNVMTYINVILFAVIKNFGVCFKNEFSLCIIKQLYALRNSFITYNLNNAAYQVNSCKIYG